MTTTNALLSLCAALLCVCMTVTATTVDVTAAANAAQGRNATSSSVLLDGGLLKQKYAGYYNDNFAAAAFSSPTGGSAIVSYIQLGNEGNHYSYKFTGFIFLEQATADTATTYMFTFKTRSDDASHVVIDGEIVVNNFQAFKVKLSPHLLVI